MAPGFRVEGRARVTHWAANLGSARLLVRHSALDTGDEDVHRGGHFNLLKEHRVRGGPALVGCSQQVLGVLQ